MDKETRKICEESRIQTLKDCLLYLEGELDSAYADFKERILEELKLKLWDK